MRGSFSLFLGLFFFVHRVVGSEIACLRAGLGIGTGLARGSVIGDSITARIHARVVIHRLIGSAIMTSDPP